MIPTWLPNRYPQLSPVLFGGSLILLMMLAPGGFLGLVRLATGWFRHRFSPSASGSPPPAGSDALAST